jgi:hypothetical protein
MSFKVIKKKQDWCCDVLVIMGIQGRIAIGSPQNIENAVLCKPELVP